MMIDGSGHENKEEEEEEEEKEEEEKEEEEEEEEDDDDEGCGMVSVMIMGTLIGMKLSWSCYRGDAFSCCECLNRSSCSCM